MFLSARPVQRGPGAVAVYTYSTSDPLVFVAPGVTVKEVAATFITLQEGGVAKRIELPADAKGSNSLSQGGSGNAPPAAAPPQQQPN